MLYVLMTYNTKLMTYDKAEWHYGGNFPAGLKPESGSTHIGMFLAWIIENNLISNFHLRESSESVQQVKQRHMTGREFLLKECDERLWDEDLNEEGNAFAQVYYKSEDDYEQYFDDYENVFDQYKTLYHVEDTWENYDKLKPLIDESFRDWQKRIH